jgi:hypothetical protein
MATAAKAVKHLMTKDRLESLYACWPARDWFSLNFDLQAPVTKVLKAAAKGNFSWVSFYIRKTATKTSALALYTLAFESAAAIVRKRVKDPVAQELFLKSIASMKRGKELRSDEYDKEKYTLVWEILYFLNSSKSSKIQQDWFSLADGAMDALECCDCVIAGQAYLDQASKRTFINKGIALFGNFKPAVK